MPKTDWEDKILHGDCIEAMKDCPDGTFDLVVTDPPYFTGLKAHKLSPTSRVRIGEHFFNDDYESQEEYERLVLEWARLFYRLLKDNAACYVYINWKQLGPWLKYLAQAGFECKNTIVWDKVRHGLNYQNYSYTHELIIFAVKGEFFPNNKEDYDARFWKDVWNIPREQTGDDMDGTKHSTQKQIGVVELPIMHASQRGDLVFDAFGGSGTTAVAARNLGRKYCLVEREEKYVEMAKNRLKQGTLL